MAAGLVREALREYRKKDPRAALRISTMRGRARIEGVSNGSLDLAIVTHDEPTIREIARRPLQVEPLVRYGLLLVCAIDAPWSRAVRDLSREGVPAEALKQFPLIVPEPDAGARKQLDAAMRRRGMLGHLDIALEIGGWGTILEHVRDGLGVGIVSEAAIFEPKRLIIRSLDPKAFRPIEAKLIGRCRGGSGDQWDLSETARAWWAVLRRIAQANL
jgi:DNA-binding transcriptional LysR family regulator